MASSAARASSVRPLKSEQERLPPEDTASGYGSYYSSKSLTMTEGHDLPVVPRKTLQASCCHGNSSASCSGEIRTFDDKSTTESSSSESNDDDDEEEEEEEEEEEGGGVVDDATELKNAGVELDLKALGSPSSPGVAPLSLLSEFVSCCVRDEYRAATILCHKILEFEPENETAREFLPVLQERLKLDDELPTESSSDSSSSSEENSSESDEEDAAVSVKSKEDLKTNNSLHHGTGHKHCT